MSEPFPTGISKEHIERFQRRAKIHFRSSYVMLSLIFVLFALCGYIFFRAQEIDGSKGSVELFQEIQVSKKYEDTVIKALEVELKGVEAERDVGQRTTLDVLQILALLGEARTKYLVLEEKERLILQEGYFADIDSLKSREELIVQKKGLAGYLAMLDNELKAVEARFKKGEVTGTDVAQVKRFIGEVNLKLQLVEQKIKAAPAAKQIKQTSANIDTLDLVRTSLIRFGGVAVTLFLMAVLVPVYRYNVRLATYYLARADTLTICRDTNVSNFGEMINLLTPTLAFDKEPRTPVDSVSSLIKETAGLVRKV
jgi:hypothetical protein